MAETVKQERTVVNITYVDLDGEDSAGYYVDGEGDLQKVLLTYGEALAIHNEFVNNRADTVGYALPRG